MKDNLIVGLDVGSSHIRMAAGELVLKAGKEHLHILGAVEVPSEGIIKSDICNLEDVVTSISSCVERLESVVEREVKRVWVSISNLKIFCKENRGMITIARPNGVITKEDVYSVLEQARTISIPPNSEILHAIPKKYLIDDKIESNDPVDMIGVRLEVNALLINMPTDNSRSLQKCALRAELEIEEFVLGVLANAELVLSKKQKEIGSVVINIGSVTTSLAVFEGGDVIHIAILPIGSEHITYDIAIGARVSMDIAENVKIKYGVASQSQISKKEAIDLKEEGAVDDDLVSKKWIAGIIGMRVEEIFSMVNAELKKIGKLGCLPAGAFLVGGGAKLSGIVEVAKNVLKIPVAIGYPLDISGSTEKVNDPAFCTSISLIKWGSEFMAEDGGVGDVLSKIVSVFGQGKDLLSKGFRSIWKQ